MSFHIFDIGSEWHAVETCSGPLAFVIIQLLENLENMLKWKK